MTWSDIPDVGSDQPDLSSSTDLYAKRFSGPIGEWLLQQQTLTLQQLSPSAPLHVLDVGGGHGQVAQPLLEAGHEVTVIASSSYALGRVRSVSHPNLHLAVGPLGELPYPDRRFDLVVSFRILAHIRDWENFVRELCRVAKRTVIVDFPIKGGSNLLEPLFFKVKKWLEKDTRRFRTFRRADVRSCFNGNGYSKTVEIGQFVLPMALHRAAGRPNLSSAFESKFKILGFPSYVGTPVILRADRT